MRILCHAQHFKGIGHFVRMHTIACGMADAHEVHLVDGGRPVARRSGARPPHLVRLPRITRDDQGVIAALETDAPVAAVMEERARLLAQAVERIRPDVVLVDIYPLSKWEVGDEIGRAIAAARRVNPGVRVVSSLRDVVPRTHHEAAPPGPYEAGVLARLAQFDAILVHGDPAFAGIEDYFCRAAEIAAPVQYTGFVVGPATSPAGSPEPGTYAVLSCGGNTKSTPFLLHAIEAFRRLSVAGALGSMPLYVFPGPGPRPGDVAALRDATRSGPFRLFDFSPDFDGWLAGSALSISRCGYNTAVQLLSSRVRSVVVPNPDNSDQDPRARRLGKLGLATVVEGATPPLGVLAAAIEDALARPPLEHDLDLGGVAATRAILEELVRGAASGAPR